MEDDAFLCSVEGDGYFIKLWITKPLQVYILLVGAKFGLLELYTYKWEK